MLSARELAFIPLRRVVLREEGVDDGRTTKDGRGTEDDRQSIEKEGRKEGSRVVHRRDVEGFTPSLS